MQDERLVENVVEIKNGSTLKMKFDCGIGELGKTIIKSRSFSGVKHDAAPLDVYHVAETLTSLQDHDLIEVVKQDNTTLGE